MPTNSCITSSLTAPIPFEQGKYNGNVKCIIHEKDQALLIRVVGQRISLQTFTSPYSAEFKQKFISLAAKHPEIISRPEFLPLCKIFQNPENVRNYNNSKINSDLQIIKRLDRDSIRPLHGDPFTGFGVVDNETGEIIGRAAVGCGDEAGESQFGLILRRDYHGKKIGKETAVLMAALALVYFENRYKVGGDILKSPVKRFTATALNNNIMSCKLLELGCKPIKSLPSGWFQRIVHFIHLDQLLEFIGYPLNMRKLYEIKGEDLRPALCNLMDINKLQVKKFEISN